MEEDEGREGRGWAGMGGAGRGKGGEQGEAEGAGRDREGHWERGKCEVGGGGVRNGSHAVWMFF